VSPDWDDRVDRLASHLEDHEPGPGLRLRLPGGRPPRLSAVLAAFLPPATLVYTERGAGLSAHAGQVSFPGGKPNPGDAGLVEAALRETGEEVGVGASAWDILGRLTPVPTPTGFLIHPFVARWTGLGPLPEPSVQTDEVASIVLLPLEELGRPGVHRRVQREWEGQRLLSHEYHVPELALACGRHQPATRIWGATGRITHELLELARD